MLGEPAAPPGVPAPPPPPPPYTLKLLINTPPGEPCPGVPKPAWPIIVPTPPPPPEPPDKPLLLDTPLPPAAPPPPPKASIEPKLPGAFIVILLAKPGVAVKVGAGWAGAAPPDPMATVYTAPDVKLNEPINCPPPPPPPWPPFPTAPPPPPPPACTRYNTGIVLATVVFDAVLNVLAK